MCGAHLRIFWNNIELNLSGKDIKCKDIKCKYNMRNDISYRFLYDKIINKNI